MVRNVGDLLCQRESYALSVEAQVERCEGPSEKGLYRLFLSDTVIFPEGGGQPADRGSLTVEADGRQLQILDAQREGLECVHIVDCPLSAGSLVKVKVDWKRRFDHMQQHSAQHLISAVGEDLGLETVSWSLGENRCSIMIPQASITQDILLEWQTRVNQLIRQRLNIQVLSKDDLNNLSPLMRDKTKVHEAATGTLRWISIEGVDVNACCGTHLSNVGELQLVVFLPGVEKVKGGQLSRVFFLAGNRALRALDEALLSQKLLSAAINVPPLEYASSFNVLQQENRQQAKTIAGLWKELAAVKGNDILGYIIGNRSSESFYWLREDATMNVLMTIATMVQDGLRAEQREWHVVLLAGPLKDGGPALILSNADAQVRQEFIQVILEQFSLKGNWNEKLKRWQGKSVQGWQHVKKAAFALNLTCIP